MNQDSFRTFQYSLASVSRWVILLGIILLLGSVGLGWLVKSFLILVGLILVTPVIIFLGFRWWLKRNLIQDQCPVCRYEFVSLNQAEFRCPNCNELLKIEHDRFQRLTPPGTIDVAAVEVPAQVIED